MKDYNIFNNHSLDEYKSEFSYYKLLNFKKSEIEQFDKENIKSRLAKEKYKNYLLKGKDWWLIDNVYYEVPKHKFLFSLHKLKTSSKVALATLLLLGVGSAIAIPIIKFTSNSDVKPVEPVKEIKAYINPNFAEYAQIIEQKKMPNNDYRIVITPTEKGLEEKKMVGVSSVSMGKDMLLKDSEYTVQTLSMTYKINLTEYAITILSSAINNHNGEISISPLDGSKKSALIRLEAGAGNRIEGTDDNKKYFSVLFNETWGDLNFYAGVINDNDKDNEFLYWEDENKIKVDNDYVFTKDCVLTPVFSKIEKNYLNVVARSNGTIGLYPNVQNKISYTFDLSQEFKVWDSTILNIKSGQKIYVKGDGTATAYRYLFRPAYTSLIYSVSGNINALRNNKDESTLLEREFRGVFNGANVIAANNLTLTSLVTPNCYEIAFKEAPYLLEGPNMPATIMAKSCYSEMFCECPSLVKVYDLPIVKTAYECCYNMYCSTSLVKAPSLSSVEDTSESCFNFMFGFNSNLKTPSELPKNSDLKIENGAFGTMYYNCPNLEEVPLDYLPYKNISANCYSLMFYHCTSLKKAPNLPAETLYSICYNQMFSGCIKLTISKTDGTLIFNHNSGVADATTDMFKECNLTDGAEATPTKGNSYYFK